MFALTTGSKKDHSLNDPRHQEASIIVRARISAVEVPVSMLRNQFTVLDSEQLLQETLPRFSLETPLILEFPASPWMQKIRNFAQWIEWKC